MAFLVPSHILPTPSGIELELVGVLDQLLPEWLQSAVVVVVVDPQLVLVVDLLLQLKVLVQQTVHVPLEVDVTQLVVVVVEGGHHDLPILEG